MPSSSSSSSAYSFKPGGSLKFKGGESASTAGKKKRKSKSSASLAVRESTGSSSARRDADRASSQAHDEPASADHQHDAVAEGGRPMTEAERKFEAIRRKRMEQRVAKEAKLSHKDRVDQFNKSLVDRTEHNDMLTVSGH